MKWVDASQLDEVYKIRIREHNWLMTEQCIIVVIIFLYTHNAQNNTKFERNISR